MSISRREKIKRVVAHWLGMYTKQEYMHERGNALYWKDAAETEVRKLGKAQEELRRADKEIR